MRYMGLDIGRRRIGVAIAKDDLKIALPRGIIHYKKHKEAIERIKKIVENEKIGVIVYGLPLNLKGQEGISASAVRRFIENLKKGLSDEVKFVAFDERFTTKEIKRIGAKKREVDDLAAVLILNAFLESCS